MKKVVFSILGIIFLFGFLKAQTLSENSQISIMTCSPGDELYSVFGHSTIRVKDYSIPIDYIYHYGTFNFREKNFYWKFIKGKLHYMLAIQSYEGFYREYTQEKRDVWELQLNIPQQKKQEIFQYLRWKSLPENRYYMYDFFYDNCATRIRDVFVKYLGDSLIIPNEKMNLTYRQAIQPSLKSRPWILLGINILLGLPADEKLDTYSAMFLPEYLDSAFSKAKIIINGKEQPFVLERKLIINSNFKAKKEPFYNPKNVFWALLLILMLVTFYEVKKQKNHFWIDSIWLIITGIVGIVILFMWFGTDHSPTKDNLNILWAIPINIIAGIWILRKKTPKIIMYYLRVLGFYYSFFLIFWFFSPQEFDKALIPLIILFIIRSFMYYPKGMKTLKFY